MATTVLSRRTLSKPWSDAELAYSVMPTSARWPSADSPRHRTIAWDKLREARDALRDLIRHIDQQCVVIENDPDLNTDARTRRTAEQGHKAITELENWPLLASTEKEVLKNIDHLEAKMTDMPPVPKDPWEIAQALELAKVIKGQQSPDSWAHHNAPGDPQLLQVALHASRHLTGLSEKGLGLVREKARTTLHPEQAQLQKDLKSAFSDLREGVEAAKKTLLKRCGVPALSAFEGKNLTELGKQLKGTAAPPAATA